MRPDTLRAILRYKTSEFEVAYQSNGSYPYLLKLYKELKELQLRIILAELQLYKKKDTPNDFVWI